MPFAPQAYVGEGKVGKQESDAQCYSKINVL